MRIGRFALSDGMPQGQPHPTDMCSLEGSLGRESDLVHEMEQLILTRSGRSSRSSNPRRPGLSPFTRSALSLL